MRPNVNTQTALTLPGPIPLQKGVGPGDEAIKIGDHNGTCNITIGQFIPEK